MKSILINDKEYQYKTFVEYTENGYYQWTEFYDGLKNSLKSYRKFWLFGKIISKKILIPNLIFRLQINIEDPNITEDEIKHKIDRELELLEQVKEITRREIL